MSRHVGHRNHCIPLHGWFDLWVVVEFVWVVNGYWISFGVSMGFNKRLKQKSNSFFLKYFRPPRSFRQSLKLTLPDILRIRVHPVHFKVVDWNARFNQKRTDVKLERREVNPFFPYAFFATNLKPNFFVILVIQFFVTPLLNR